MSLLDSITRPIFAKPKSRSCPSCGNKLDGFHVNLEDFSMQCQKCGDEFDPRRVFHDADILVLAQYVPPEKRDEFLRAHGFEKQPANRTPKWMVTGLILVMALCGIVLGVKSFYDVWWKGLVYGLVGAILILLIILYYQQEKKPRWKHVIENSEESRTGFGIEKKRG